MKTKYYSFAVTLLLLFTFSSCKKEQADTVSHNYGNMSTKILTFKNIEEYSSSLKEVLSFTDSQRKVWEEARNFKSYGRTCDEVYQSIHPENLISIDDFKKVVASNNKYLVLIEDSNGELYLETKLGRSANRYFLNENQMFQIGNTLYKVLDNIIISGSEAKIEVIKAINETNLHILATKHSLNLSKPISNLKDAQYNCGTEADDYESSGNERTHMWIDVQEIDHYSGGTPLATQLYCTYTIRPYKRTLGIWYWCTRTVSCNLKVAVDYCTWSYPPTNPGPWQRVIKTYSNSGTSTSVLSGVFFDIDEYVGGVISTHIAHFGGFNCWADTPSSPTVNLQCNTNLVP